MRNPKPETFEVCNRLRTVRESRGLSRADLAAKLGTTITAVAGLESPARSLRTPTLRRVAIALECGIGELVDAPKRAA